jgi:hypothetical protein
VSLLSCSKDVIDVTLLVVVEILLLDGCSEKIISRYSIENLSSNFTKLSIKVIATGKKSEQKQEVKVSSFVLKAGNDKKEAQILNLHKLSIYRLHIKCHIKR